jgi:hypothetical protein
MGRVAAMRSRCMGRPAATGSGSAFTARAAASASANSRLLPAVLRLPPTPEKRAPAPGRG